MSFVLAALLAVLTLPSAALDATAHSAPPAADPISDSLATYYARQDTRAVQRLYRDHARTREQRLLCRYRLYPLTRDARYLRDIPSERGVTSARELALISALWAYKAADGPRLSLPRNGRRSERILDLALARDADDPYALLVKGQSLLYKPRVFGGDVAAAQRTFEQLRTVLRRHRAPGIHPFEADVWTWMALRKQDRAAADRMQRRLLQRRPPPLFRAFLTDPPS